MEPVISSICSTNTSYAIYCLFAMFLLGKTRSGAMVAVSKILQVGTTEFIYLLISAIFAALFAFFITCYLGRCASKVIAGLNYRNICIFSISIIFILVYLFTSFLGLFILLVSSLIGFIPLIYGVRRVNGMGVILFPLILNHFLAI